MIFISQLKKTKAWLMSQSKWVEPQVIQGCLISKPCSSPSASLLFQTGPWRENPHMARSISASAMGHWLHPRHQEAGCESLGWAASGPITVYWQRSAGQGSHRHFIDGEVAIREE